MGALAPHERVSEQATKGQAEPLISRPSRFLPFYTIFVGIAQPSKEIPSQRFAIHPSRAFRIVLAWGGIVLRLSALKSSASPPSPDSQTAPSALSVD